MLSLNEPVKEAAATKQVFQGCTDVSLIEAASCCAAAQVNDGGSEEENALLLEEAARV